MNVVEPPLNSGKSSIVPRIADRFADLCDCIDKIAVYLSAAGLVTMALILVTEVMLRIFVSRSTLIADEIASYMLAFVSFMALGHTLRTGDHLRVELITNHLSAAARKITEIVSILIAIVSVCFFTAWLFKFVLQSYAYKVDSQSQIDTPLWIPQSVLCVGTAVLILALISRLIRVLRNEAVL